LNVEKKKEQITQALERAGLVEVEIMDNAIVDEVDSRMLGFMPHIVHYIGHGGLIRTNGREEGCLVLDDRQRKYQLCYEEQCSALLAGETCRLVVLNACKTAASSRIRRSVGLAPRLVRDGIPAVVAMRYEIVDDAAITFSHRFYWALACGWAVDAAVAWARKGLFLEEESSTRSDRSWFKPVVFMHAGDGRVF
jgi:CHAT domain-containing protein